MDSRRPALLALLTMLSLFQVAACRSAEAAQPAASQPGALRIVAIGDSITHGRGGHGVGFDAPTQSWRYPFWKALVRSGKPIELVGTMRRGHSGDPEWPDVDGKRFDRDHEGRWGIRIDETVPLLRAELARLRADVALVLLGANDVMRGEPLRQIASEWQTLLGVLRDANPRMVIVVGLFCADGVEAEAYREMLRRDASGWSTPASPVVVADGCEGWVADPAAAGTHTVDWIHPNARGDEQIAEAFRRALGPWL